MIDPGDHNVDIADLLSTVLWLSGFLLFVSPFITDAETRPLALVLSFVLLGAGGYLRFRDEL